MRTYMHTMHAHTCSYAQRGRYASTLEAQDMNTRVPMSINACPPLSRIIYIYSS